MKKNLSLVILTIAAIAFLNFAASITTYAQTATATLVGRTTDEAEAALPGVKITLTQTTTGQTRTVTSDESGNYVFLLLPAGKYQLTAELAGFQRLVRSEFELQVDQRAGLDLALKAGQITETVEIKDEASILQTESASVGTVISQEKIVRLPLNGREFQQLALLVPGAVPAAQGSSLSFRGGFNVGGARESSNQFLLDGADNNNSSANQYVFRPSVDMIQEFKVQTNSYSAEFGRGAGGQVNIITKSGTNEYHGNAFEFLRNSAFDAKNFFDLPTSSPSFKRNQFGATFGGPLPFLNFGEGGPVFNSGKNRTFFFLSYEGLRLRQGVTRSAAVPSLLAREGNFGANARIRDPQRAGNCNATDTTACFPNGIIPTNRINPIGLAIVRAFPMPNNASDPVRNLVSTLSRPQDADQFSVRVDHRISEKANIFFRYSINQDQQIDVFDTLVGTINTNLPGFGRDDNQRTKSISLSYTQIINPRTVNEFRFGYNFLKQIRAPENKTDFVTALGLTGLSSDPRTFGFPAFRVTGFDPLGDNVQLPQERSDSTYQFIDNITLQRGAHTIKAGFDLRPFRSVNFNPGSSRGDFRFTGLYTNNGLADLLLGLIAQDTRGVGSAERVRLQKSYGFYVQDDWKVNRRLTFNLGLRYELNPPLTEPNNLLSNFDVATRGIIIAGQNGLGRQVYNTDKNNFAPRVGFAWQPFDQKTVIRGGYGIYYDLPIVGNELGALYGNPPFRSVSTFNGTLANPISLNNPFPTQSLGAATLSPTGVQRDLQTSYLQNFSLGMQREILKDLVVEISYIGNKGTNLLRNRNINQAVLGAGSIASRRPFAGFGNIPFRESSASSNYHSLQARAEKRFAQGFTFLASYTFSKAIDDSSGVPASTATSNNPQNSFDLRSERGLSEFDVRHRFVASFIYELPFGKGKQFLQSGIAAQIFGNFEIAGIVAAQTGRPFTPRISSDRSNTGQLQDRPNIVGNPRLDNPDPQLWFNTAAFAIPAAGTFGNAGRNILTGPGYSNTDVALVKRIGFGEVRNLELRVEFFNLFNHPNFDLPNAVADSAQFGRIFSAGAARQIQLGLKFTF
ncbi:MAG: TonB-dependent receptor [Acidobacteriota bacterium]|nr:TonB-dependent receptor [Acidobacteriota bacterium]